MSCLSDDEQTLLKHSTLYELIRHFYKRMLNFEFVTLYILLGRIRATSAKKSRIFFALVEEEAKAYKANFKTNFFGNSNSCTSK